jgi:hypothetical protein
MDSTLKNFPAKWKRRAEPKFVCGLPLHTGLTLYNLMIKTTQESTRAHLVIFLLEQCASLKGYGAEIFISDFSVLEWVLRKAPYSIADFKFDFKFGKLCRIFYVVVILGSSSSLQCLFLRVVGKIIK